MKESTLFPRQRCDGEPQEQQQAISDEEAVRILLSGGTLVFRVPHPVKGEGCDVTEPTLLPCPHCGGEPQELQHDCHFWIQCTKCYGVDGQTCLHTSADEAAKAWNMRFTCEPQASSGGAAWMRSELRSRFGDDSEAEEGFYAGYVAGAASYGADGVPLEFVEVMNAVVLELENKKCDGRGNAPGHGHAVPGVWDEDNGDLAGAPCAWCALWAKGKAMLAEADATPRYGRQAHAPATPWIKCSEQLPRVDEAVLLQCADGECGIAARCDMANGTWEWGWAGTPPFFNLATGRWDCHEYRSDDVDEPISWMPIPASADQGCQS